MANNNISFPYPVLGRDDVASTWRISNISVFPAVEDVTIRFKVTCDDPDVKAMKATKQVGIVARWECSSTLSSGEPQLDLVSTHSDGWTFSTSIDQREVRDVVTMSVYVVALQDIPHMLWKHQHEDYDGESFDIKKGNYLSVPQGFSFNAVKMWDPANPPLNSCIRIVEDEQQKHGIRLGFDGEILNIFVSPSISIWMHENRDDSKALLSIIVLPALIEAIWHMRSDKKDGDSGDALAERDWAKAITAMVRSEQVPDTDDPIATAQRLLADPIEQMSLPEEDEDND
ncbi:hypothetical protein [Bifidobacterium mongoliense]|uniref:hypothetical protein n=1 Tax=Bifidobacterium mongoliense TaxID=518643 RepID=UPI0030ED5C43